MTEWNWSAEKERAGNDIRDIKHADLRDMIYEERHEHYLLENELDKTQGELVRLKAAHAWIKTSERLPADDARVLALVLDNAGNERTEIVTVWSGPVWRYEDNGLQIDPEIITGWMPLPVRTR